MIPSFSREIYKLRDDLKVLLASEDDDDESSIDDSESEIYYESYDDLAEPDNVNEDWSHDSEHDSESGDEFAQDNLFFGHSSAIESLHSYINCLMDLVPSMEASFHYTQYTHNFGSVKLLSSTDLQKNDIPTPVQIIDNAPGEAVLERKGVEKVQEAEEIKMSADSKARSPSQPK